MARFAQLPDATPAERPQPLVVPLSDRELEVLRLLADGRTNREIARALSLSPRTVETYLSRLFAKLNASCRAEVAGKVAPLMRTSTS